MHYSLKSRKKKLQAEDMVVDSQGIYNALREEFREYRGSQLQTSHSSTETVYCGDETVHTPPYVNWADVRCHDGEDMTRSKEAGLIGN